MSRERPQEAPPALPDQARGRTKRETPKQLEARQMLEGLKRLRGPALLAGVFNPVERYAMAGPRFIRAGYEAGLLDALHDFYAARPRPWRPAHRDPCRQTHKERLNAARGGRHARRR